VDKINKSAAYASSFCRANFGEPEGRLMPAGVTNNVTWTPSGSTGRLPEQKKHSGSSNKNMILHEALSIG
jgi:hypothetical protein